MDVRISGFDRTFCWPFCWRRFRLLEDCENGRQRLANILRRLHDRLIVVVGLCCIHDTLAAMDYGELILCQPTGLVCCVNTRGNASTGTQEGAEQGPTDRHANHAQNFGNKGLINDPDLDGSFNIKKGLRVARELLATINELGIPVSPFFLFNISLLIMLRVV
ncbi:hypothetical protein PsorP6_015974 [Peronosclerospora sorghi]|uniref:Uncharacterized protein n=1 Tax=Peronosclerospora sorghi TaxID=230839 RepID=A0ACC0WP40_9STRA|nr:hypothetical protein PsorP6_015974 [Peronosclerospora sorghi]